MEPRLPEGVRDLTDRQREVARLVADGLTNAEIGNRLGISLDGAKYHVSELLTRLDLERRDQIADWVRAERAATRRRWAVAALAATLGSALVAAAVLAVLALDPQIGSQIGSAVTPTSEADDRFSLLSSEPTPEPNIPQTLPAPVTLADLTNAERLDLLYQPIPWNDGRLTNRIPPPSEEAAIDEDRVLYQDGYEFPGPPGDGFDRDVYANPACVAATVGGDPAQSTNWLLSLRPREDAGPGSYVLELTPSHTYLPGVAGLLPDPGFSDPNTSWPPPATMLPLRIRAIDTANGESTHVIELWTEDPADSDGVIRLAYDAPRATRWLAVVTAGPLWGCFYLETERAAEVWPATRGEIAPSLPAPDAASPAEQEIRTLAGVPATGTPNRTCVEAGQASVRSGEIGVDFLGALWSDWPPNARVVGFGSLWVPQYPPESGSLSVRAVIDGDELGPLHALDSIDSTEWIPAWFDGSDPGVDPPTYSYRSSFLLPLPGTWSLIATVPPVNWGCFVVTVGLSQQARFWE